MAVASRFCNHHQFPPPRDAGRYPNPENVDTNGRLAKWLDALHRYTAIAQRVGEQLALLAVVVVAVTAATGRTRHRPTPHRQVAAPVYEPVVAGVAVWSRAGSSLSYTPAQVLALTPIRNTVEQLEKKLPDLRDVFLCHAWDDRQGPAKELHDLLVSLGVSVWFSEKDVGLGVPLMRAIDKGLANSRVGIVLVTPALLRRLPAEGIADKELSALLARDRLIPIVHETTYEALREVSRCSAQEAA